MFALKHLFPIAPISLAGAGADVLTGDDIDFSVQTDPFKRVSQGSEFSTSEPPTGVLLLEDLLSLDPRRLRGPSLGAVAPYFYQHMIPWPKTNQSVADDGWLRIHYAYSDDSTFPTNEPLNATIQVWQQTQDVFRLLNRRALAPIERRDALAERQQQGSAVAGLPARQHRPQGPQWDGPLQERRRRSVEPHLGDYCGDGRLNATASPSASPSASAGAGDGSANSTFDAASPPVNAIGWTLMGAAFALFI
ncbi:hypothetical protein F5B21DRAFT_498762 [Xylaria acuta]|nr:hypothetical protein F5B21DRAFT_498762 [Xylaria acuta]